MANSILMRTLHHLRGRVCRTEVSEVHFTRFFTTVGLTDGSIGACMSYYELADAVLDILESACLSLCTDPFSIAEPLSLQRCISEHVSDQSQAAFILASLSASVISAMSAPFIRAGGDECFEVSQRRPRDWTGGASTALVVGFGGMLTALVSEPHSVRTVHVIDLFFERSDRMQRELESLKKSQQNKTISASRSVSSADELARYDLIAITGSTLCNGTLEWLLSHVRRDALVILQGQSASIHPKILFDDGVRWIATTLKPAVLGELAGPGHSGDNLQPLLQGGLPWIYLLPRASRPADTAGVAMA